MSETSRLSRSQIDKAGAILRRHGLGDPVDPAALAASFDLLERYRREWEGGSNLLSSVRDELGRRTRELFRDPRKIGLEQDVSHRLKRAERIVDKLVRERTMALSRMQDIGGCRVVVLDLPEMRALLGELETRWSLSIRQVAKGDYVKNPHRDGYRAHHLVVERDSHLVEIQIRTLRQHWWANAVERLEQLGGGTLRGGTGDPELVRALQTASELFALLDRDEAIPDQVANDLDEALSAIRRAITLRS